MSIISSEFITNVRDDYREAGRFRKTVRKVAVVALAGGAFSLGVSGIEASMHSNDIARDTLISAIILGDIGVSAFFYEGVTSVFSALDEERMKIKQASNGPSSGAVQEGL